MINGKLNNQAESSFIKTKTKKHCYLCLSETQATLLLFDGRVLNGSGWPTNPTRPAGSGRKNTSEPGRVGPRASFFIKHISCRL